MSTFRKTSIPTREKITEMHNAGATVGEMCKALKLNKSTVDYHRKALGLVAKRYYKNREGHPVPDWTINTVGKWLSARWIP